jgi:hypothetical protein
MRVNVNQHEKRVAITLSRTNLVWLLACLDEAGQHPPMLMSMTDGYLLQVVACSEKPPVQK